jgi:hypothetical protein
MQEESQRRPDHEHDAGIETECEGGVVLEAERRLLELLDKGRLGGEDVGDEAGTEGVGDDGDFAAEGGVAFAEELVDTVRFALLWPTRQLEDGRKRNAYERRRNEASFACGRVRGRRGRRGRDRRRL